ncbi:MAG: glucosyltransferase domain-containing protein [Lachnospiraceae bacterium]|nr:glucosyltransferase domain-containing protein [Lachnospiraceae bacterium]
MIRKLKEDKRSLFILICSLLWGFAAHGMAMLNKYSYHDDVPHFNWVGETYGLGRWGLGVAGTLTEKLFASRNYSLPLINGILTIAAIAVMVYLICLKTEINDRFLIASLTGVMVCFPAVTNIFGYVFTAPQYYIASMLGVLGAFIFYSKKNIRSMTVCVLLMAVSTGVYQSNIPVNLMILLLFMLYEVYERDMSRKEYIILGVKNAVICAAFMIVYFLVNSVFLAVTGQDMYDYKGVSTFGRTGPAGYLYRIYTAYKRFIKPADYINYNGVSANMFPWNLKYLHMLLVLLTLVLIVWLLKKKFSLEKSVQLLILVLVSPLFSYFFYVMVAEEDAHGGMAYGEVFMFTVAAFFVCRAMAEKDGKKDRMPLFAKCLTVIMLMMAVMFARFANVCYLKAGIMQAEAINYYNRLIERIETTEGYTKDTPVLYVEGRSKNDDDFSGNKLFDPIYLPPYQGNSIINDFSWEETMNMWCGFSRVTAPDDLADTQEVKDMPVYPEPGSIKMIDKTLVVKFADR